jgi:hypothetical protein
MCKHVCVCVCVCLCVRSVSWAVEVVGIIIHVKSFSDVSFSNVLWSDFVKRFGHRDVLTVVTGRMQAQANKQAWCCCAKLVCCCCKGASGREPPSPRSPILSHGGKIPIFWNVGTLGSDSLLGGRNLEMGVSFSVTAEWVIGKRRRRRVEKRSP